MSLDKLIEIANKNNKTVTDDIIENNLDDDDIDEVYNFLKKNNIKIIADDIDDYVDDYKFSSKINSLNLYMHNIGKIPLLKPEEEYELGVLAKKGDKVARDKLIESNLRLVVHVAKKYTTNTSQSLLDLIQEGNLGLYRAAEKYDVDTGYKFSTYAVYWIRQAISQSINDYSRSIRIPTHALNLITKINKIKNEMTIKLNREPTDEELCKEVGIEIDVLNNLDNISRLPLSLDYTINDDNDTDVSDLVKDKHMTPEELTIAQSRKEALIKILSTLSPKEKEIIIQRYGIDDGCPKTLDEIGRNINLTRERVRQLEYTAMRKLRAPARLNALREI